MTERERSPWLYIGLGCLLAVILAVGSCVAIGWFGMEKAKEMAEEMTDPAKREAKVLATLGAEELPPGYHPVMAMSMPLGMMEMAMLSDEPPPEDLGRMEEPPMLRGSGFMYVAQRELGEGKSEELSAYLRGESRSRGPLENIQTNVRIDERQVVRRGELELDGISYLWSAYRGEVETDGPDTDAILTIFQALCPEPKRVHVGIWWVPVRSEESGTAERRDDETAADEEAPEPADVQPVEATAEPVEPSELDLAGTPADPEALREFVSYFDLCG